MLRIFVSFKSSGITLGGIHADVETLNGNAIFYRSMEGFLESLPQLTYQTSIVMRKEESISKKERKSF